MVLGRLVNDAALDGEAARLGLSTGDEAVRAAGGGHARLPGARRQLRPRGLRLRARPRRPEPRPSSRACCAARRRASWSPAAVQAAAALPESAALTLLGYAGERRSFDWLRLDAGLLAEPVPAPTEAELQARVRRASRPLHPARRPGRSPTPASTPEALAAAIEIPEEELRAAYDADARALRHARAAHARPHRLRHRRGGGGGEGAARRRRDRLRRARRRARAARRPRSTRARWRPRTLAAEARDAVFGADGPGIVGPVPTPLGPSIYRVNAVAGRAAPRPSRQARGRAGARARARGGAGADRRGDRRDRGPARRRRDARGDRVRDGHGARLGRAERRDRRAGSPTIRPSASCGRGARPGVETDLAELADGGLVALRVEAVEPPAPIPLRRGPRPGRRRLDRRAHRRGAAARWPRATPPSSRAGSSFARARRAHRPPRRGPPGRSPRSDAPPEGAPPALVADVFAAEAGGDGDAGGRRRRSCSRRSPRSRRSTRPPRRTPGAQQTLRDQLRDQAADDALGALHRRAARRRRGAGEPGADRRHPRPVPLSPARACSSSRPFEEFEARFAAGANQVVWTRLVADLDTPGQPDAEADRGAQGQLPARRASPAARCAAATRSWG